MSQVQDISRLDPALRKLVRRAVQARKNAYAPYSRFRVGSAILGSNGKIYTGCNVENCSYTGLCAERVAVGKMVSRGERSISFIAVAAAGDVPPFPCGNCLQVIAEFGLDSIVVAVNGKGTVFRQLKFRELFPYSFTTEQLKK